MLMIDLDNQSGIDFDISLLENIKNTLEKDKDIELLFVDSKTMQEINLQTRDKDKTTDVLSFPYDDMPILGSIVINTELSLEISKKMNHSFEDEMQLMFIHAMLHLQGFDHEADNGEMYKQEEILIKKFSLPKSLIMRNTEHIQDQGYK